MLGLCSRSAKDLRRGHSAPAEWLDTARQYFIAGTVGDDPDGNHMKLFGDAQVSTPNASADALVPEVLRRTFAAIKRLLDDAFPTALNNNEKLHLMNAAKPNQLLEKVDPITAPARAVGSLQSEITGRPHAAICGVPPINSGLFDKVIALADAQQ